MDEEINAPAPDGVEAKTAIATEIYTAWRNAHMNEIPVALFNRLESVSGHLIKEIAAHL